MSEMVTLKMTREHALLVQNACELWMRMTLGQAHIAVEVYMPFDRRDESVDSWLRRRDIAIDGMRASLRAMNTTERRDALAYEVWGSLRYATTMHDEPSCKDSRGWPPLGDSGLTMPVVTIQEE